MDLPSLLCDANRMASFKPKVARAMGYGASSQCFLHFWPCIMVQGPVEERKKNPELVQV